MYEYSVSGMTCGGCASSIQRALKKVDPEANVQVELDQQLVRVQSRTGQAEIASLIEKAGYEVLKSQAIG